ncbi:hypothetical protein [Lentzea sp. E54]|uniref:hypothetical protein n=1 Tax=Lentzea xerophila TaxID=3435883 RepID=UPI003DA5F4B3
MDGVRNETSGVVIQVRQLHGGRFLLPDLVPDETPLVVTPTLTWTKERYGMHSVVYTPIEAVTGTGNMLEFPHGDEPPDNTRLKLLVEGTRPQAVVLTDLTIAVTARRPAAPAGGIELFSPQLFYKLEPKWFRADLSARSSVSVVPNRAHSESAEFPYVVHHAEPEHFVVDLELGGQDVEWLAELHWTSAGKSGVLQISDRGAPFLSRPPGGRPRYDWDFDTKRWRLVSRP